MIRFRWSLMGGLYIGWERQLNPYTTLTNFTHAVDLLLHPLREWRFITRALPEACLKAGSEQ